MATNGQFSWPSVGSSVAAYGQFGMAANSGAPGDQCSGALNLRANETTPIALICKSYTCL